MQEWPKSDCFGIERALCLVCTKQYITQSKLYIHVLNGGQCSVMFQKHNLIKGEHCYCAQ